MVESKALFVNPRPVREAAKSQKKKEKLRVERTFVIQGVDCAGRIEEVEEEKLSGGRG
jgi:hypothetical protein